MGKGGQGMDKGVDKYAAIMLPTAPDGSLLMNKLMDKMDKYPIYPKWNKTRPSASSQQKVQFSDLAHLVHYFRRRSLRLRFFLSIPCQSLAHLAHY